VLIYPEVSVELIIDGSDRRNRSRYCLEQNRAALSSVGLAAS